MHLLRYLLGCSVLIAAVTVAAIATEPTIEWSRTLPSTQVEILADVVPTVDSGYAVFGTRTNEDGLAQIMLLKFDAIGDLEWENAYGEADSEFAGSMIVRQDGGYLLAGTRIERWGTSKSTVIHWVSETGELESTEDRPYSDRGDLLNPLVFEPRAGLCTILGSWVSTEGNGIDHFTLGFGGAALRDFPCPGLESKVVTDAVVFGNGSAIFLVNSESFGAANAGSRLISLPPEGGCDWTQPITGTGQALARTSDNHLMIVGQFQGHSYLVKVDDSGQLLWSETYGVNCTNFVFAVEATDDGGAVATGHTFSCETPAGLLIFRVDADGNLLWSKVFGQTFNTGVSIHGTSDGGYIVGAICGPDEYGCNGFRIIKLSPDSE